jgi:FKBP-type peptidyl-prolyl cis-trans isomerase FkpA
MIRTIPAMLALTLALAACSETPQNRPELPAAPGTPEYMMDQLEYLSRLTPDQGWRSTPSGLRYRRVSGNGAGLRPRPTDTVTIHYRGTLTDGTEFDSSLGGQPITFPLAQLIPGWQEGVPLMSVGDRYEFAIPFTAAYGPAGSPPQIPGYATLLFTIDLIGIGGTPSQP